MYFILNKIIELRYSYFFTKIIAYIFIQNMITIAVIPLYASWGLSFSLLSFVGNLIFLPFLTLYIFLSIIILFLFFFDLVIFSFFYAQKILLSVWIYSMTLISTVCPIDSLCFINSPLLSYPLCISSIILLLFLKRLKINDLIVCFFSIILLCGIILYLHFCIIPSPLKVIRDGNSTYILRKITDKKVLISNNGKKNRLYLSDKKIQHMILPEIKKAFGIQKPSIIL